MGTPQTEKEITLNDVSSLYKKDRFSCLKWPFLFVKDDMYTLLSLYNCFWQLLLIFSDVLLSFISQQHVARKPECC